MPWVLPTGKMVLLILQFPLACWCSSQDLQIDSGSISKWLPYPPGKSNCRVGRMTGHNGKLHSMLFVYFVKGARFWSTGTRRKNWVCGVYSVPLLGFIVELLSKRGQNTFNRKDSFLNARTNRKSSSVSFSIFVQPWTRMSSTQLMPFRCQDLWANAVVTRKKLFIFSN